MRRFIMLVLVLLLTSMVVAACGTTTTPTATGVVSDAEVFKTISGAQGVAMTVTEEDGSTHYVALGGRGLIDIGIRNGQTVRVTYDLEEMVTNSESIITVTNEDGTMSHQTVHIIWYRIIDIQILDATGTG